MQANLSPPAPSAALPFAKRSRAYGFLVWLALLLGMLAFVLALTPDVLARLQPPPERPVGQSVRDGLGQLSEGVTGLFSNRYDVPADAAPREVSAAEITAVAADLLAILTLLIAALGWIAGERYGNAHARPLAVALAFAVASLAYSLQIKALCALVGAMLVLALLGIGQRTAPLNRG